MRRKPHWLQSLVSWLKSRLRRKRWVLTWAFRSVNIVNLVARLLDWFL
jgi:hypothetical protein